MAIRSDQAAELGRSEAYRHRLLPQRDEAAAPAVTGRHHDVQALDEEQYQQVTSISSRAGERPQVRSGPGM
jgi:hypothetical protein